MHSFRTAKGANGRDVRHARSSADAFVQITRYALKAPEHLTPEAVAVDIAASLDWVLHIH